MAAGTPLGIPTGHAKTSPSPGDGPASFFGAPESNRCCRPTGSPHTSAGGRPLPPLQYTHFEPLTLLAFQ